MCRVRNVSRNLATAIAVPMFVVNVLFCLFTALVGCLFCADLVISLMYQFAMPTSAATAISSLVLLTVLSKWIIIFIAALADWRRWPANYYKFHKLLTRMLRRGAASSCRMKNRLSRSRGIDAHLTPNAVPNDDSRIDDDGTVFGAIQAGPNRRPPAEMGWDDARELLRYVACALIWITSMLVSIKNAFTGTWIFVICTFVFVIANTLFDVRRLKRRPPGSSAGIFILYRKENLRITIFSLAIALVPLSAVVARFDSSQISGGGHAAVGVAYAFTILFILGLVAIYFKEPFGFLAWHELDFTSLPPRLMALVDLVLLIIPMIVLFVTTGTEAGVTVIVITVFVGVCHGVYVMTKQTVRLHSPDVGNEADSDDGDVNGGGNISLGNDMAEGTAALRRQEGNYGGADDADVAQAIQYESQGDVSGARRLARENSEYYSDKAQALLREGKEPFDSRQALRRLAYSTFIFFAVFVAFTSLIDTEGVSYAQTCPGKFPGNKSQEQGRYALCDLVYPPSRLNTVDFAALTAVSYMDYQDKVDALKLFFPHTTAIVDDELSQYSRGNNRAFVGVNFTVFRFVDENVTVMAVRGSFTSIDWLQDLYIMSDTLAIMFGKAVLPLPLSDSVAASLVAIGGTFKFGMNQYTNRVEEAIDVIRSTYPHDALFVTGHSLGGFTANVIAARTSTRSVTMSPIGTGYTYKRYGFDRAAADKFVLSLIPEGDLVPKIDEQLGLLQFFVPPESCTFSNSFCHGIASTFAAFVRNCGDPLGRGVVTTRGTTCG
jgi:hypothetical protein